MIRKLQNEIGKQLLDVIRGRLPLSSLSDIGIEIADVKGELRLQSKLALESIRPGIGDLLRGLQLYQAHPKGLRLWSFLLLAETAIDLSELENTRVGGRLLKALWDASENGQVESQLLNLLENDTPE